MELSFQESAIAELNNLASSDRHSVLIEGPSGCGKTYLSRMYGKLLKVSDFLIIQPNVQSIRDALDASINLNHPTLFCIENLDSGVLAVSYALLKFLEEPTSKVYIIVTCKSRFNIPETIISRSVCVSINTPILSDVNSYAESQDPVKYNQLKTLSVWKGVRSLLDVDYVFKLKPEQIGYYKDAKSMLNLRDSISSCVWKLSHYPDGSEADARFVLNYLFGITRQERLKQHIISCLNDLSTSRFSQHAILSKFLFDYKYGE